MTVEVFIHVLRPVRIKKPVFYHGRILFEDGSPPILNPVPWPGAEIRIDFPYAGSPRIDSKGYFKVYFTKEQYEKIKARYNAEANAADFLFLTRAAYGGVMRFRKADGYMSTPCGAHKPIHFGTFSRRVDEWAERVKGAEFFHREYGESLDRAKEGDVVYCDPPYSHSQAILYGAQGFDQDDLFKRIEKAKSRGVFVALSLDGSKKSGAQDCDYDIPPSLFERHVAVNCGRSMLKRFQMGGKSLEGEVVTDRLLLTH